MKNQNEFNKYSDEVLDVDEVEGTDIKINPDYYIHKALLRAQDGLSKENPKEGFLQYCHCVEHIEVLCHSAKMLDNEYAAKIKVFTSSDDYKNQPNDVQLIRLAHKKLKLMLSGIFSNKLATFNLKH